MKNELAEQEDSERGPDLWVRGHDYGLVIFSLGGFQYLNGRC